MWLQPLIRPIPLIGLLTPLMRWWQDRHFQRLADGGFDDLRRAHEAVVINLPASGLRLTELAQAIGISKQATAELVDDLVAKGYLQRTPDPDDGRAKLITWAERGFAAHRLTITAFAELEDELADLIGERSMTQLRRSLQRLFSSLPADGSA